MLSRLTSAALALFVASAFLGTGAAQAQGQGSKVLAKGEFHKRRQGRQGHGHGLRAG